MSSNCHDFDPEHASGLCIQYDALPHHTSQPSSAEELCLGKKIAKDVGFEVTGSALALSFFMT